MRNFHAVIKFCTIIPLTDRTNSELNAINNIEAIDTIAILVLTYSSNIINWTVQDVKNLDRKTRKLLIKERMQNPNQM